MTSDKTPDYAETVKPVLSVSIAYPASSNVAKAKLPVVTFSVGFCKCWSVKDIEVPSVIYVELKPFEKTIIFEDIPSDSDTLPLCIFVAVVTLTEFIPPPLGRFISVGNVRRS